MSSYKPMTAYQNIDAQNLAVKWLDHAHASTAEKVGENVKVYGVSFFIDFMYCVNQIAENPKKEINLLYSYMSTFQNGKTED